MNVMNAAALKPSDIILDSEEKSLYRHARPVLFSDANGRDVKNGDIVSFYLEGNIYPSSGTVETLKGLRVACFDMVFYRWNYYPIAL